MNHVTLNNGVQMPIVGFGTAYLPFERISDIIGEAYKDGYRKFDTAGSYGNEAFIGEAFKNHNINRNDIFIQTKLEIPNLYFSPYRSGRGRFFNIRKHSVSYEVERSLKNLDTDYIDLFLIHWPYPNFAKFYKDLAKYLRDGTIRAIGVSSCLPPHLEYLKQKCDIVPALNQFEISPLNAQVELVKYCLDHNIQPEAMSTFSHFRSNKPRTEILENDIISSIAKHHNKTTAQIVNRWLIQRGISIVPKSRNPKHIAENIDLFDFSLNKDEMLQIGSLDGGKFLNYDPSVTAYSVPRSMRNCKWFK